MAIFERIGRALFEKNHPLVFFCLLAIPFVTLIGFLGPRLSELLQTQQTLDSTALRGRLALEKRTEKGVFLERYTNFEPYFMDHYLETLPLLQESLERLRALHNHPACKDREALVKRIAFLESGENRLAFAEEDLRSTATIKETEEKLLRPVEVDASDLSRLLSLIEEVSIGPYKPNPRSPQLLIKDFVLTKTEGNHYKLDLTLIKREFLKTDEQKT